MRNSKPVFRGWDIEAGIAEKSGSVPSRHGPTGARCVALTKQGQGAQEATRKSMHTSCFSAGCQSDRAARSRRSCACSHNCNSRHFPGLFGRADSHLRSRTVYNERVDSQIEVEIAPFFTQSTLTNF